jgi:Fic family protein
MLTIEELLEKIDRFQQEIHALKPLNHAELQQLKEYYRIGLTYSSNALEGNSLTETETKIVLEEGITIGGKPLRDHLEAVGHSEAFNLIYRLQNTNTITEEDVLELHRLFYRKIDPQNAGNYRQVRVFITGSTFKVPPPSKIQALMRAFIQQLSVLRKRHHPVVYAALVHKEFIEIHPFVDGNGRTARLLMNLALLQHGYPIVIIPPVLRSDYINALEMCHKHDDTPFIRLIATAVLEAQKDFLRLFKDEC